MIMVVARRSSAGAVGNGDGARDDGDEDYDGSHQNSSLQNRFTQLRSCKYVKPTAMKQHKDELLIIGIDFAIR